MSVPPLISIIIPAYNAAEIIDEALQSIKLQNFKDFEVIIIDALSTDNTVKIASDFNSDMNLTILSEKDKGIYDAMNKGIRVSNGQWLYFMGADDRLASDDVLKNISGALNIHNDIVYGNIIWKPQNEHERGEWQPEKLLYVNINHQRIFYRKEIFGLWGNYNINYPVSADYELNIRFFTNNEIVKKYISVDVGFYNSQGYSANKIDGRFWADWATIFPLHFERHCSKKNIYGTLAIPGLYYIKNRKYIDALKIAMKHFMGTGSLGFPLLMMKNLIKHA